MIAKKEITITCGETFSGIGYMKAPMITITTKKFEYIGTIHCDHTCTITVEEYF